MSLLVLVIVLIACGVGLWAVNEYVPMQPGIKKLLNVLVIVVLVILVVIFLFQILGLSTGGANLRIN